MRLIPKAGGGLGELGCLYQGCSIGKLDSSRWVCRSPNIGNKGNVRTIRQVPGRNESVFLYRFSASAKHLASCCIQRLKPDNIVSREQPIEHFSQILRS